MKKIILFAIFILGASQWTFSAPLKNIPVRLSQPDGQIIECFASGDEFYNYLHDANGFTIVKGEGGYYYYAMHDSQGEVVASPYRVNTVVPASVGLQPYVKISQKAYQQRRHEREQYIKPVKRPANRELNHGVYNNLVVFIRFAGDTYHSTPYSTVDSMFNASNYESISLHNYFHHASYNQLDLRSYCYPIPDGETILSYEDIYPKEYYMPYDPETNPIGYHDGETADREFSMLERAIYYVEDQVSDTLDLDYNDDGMVDNVVFVIKGEPGEWASLLWPHRWCIYDRYVPLHNLQVYDFNLQLEIGGYFNVSTLCHEMNHSLGAPDLYHYNGGPDPVGSWDLMCGTAEPPQQIGMYMKLKYGNWIDNIPEITEYGTYELEADSWEGNRRNAYKIASSNPYQYYVIEHRDDTRLFDENLPGGGLLIYRIDTRYDGNAGYNGYDAFDEVYLFRPNGYIDEVGDLDKAAFSAERGRIAFNHETNPAPYFTNGQYDEEFCIFNISSRGDRMSFTYGPANHVLIPQNPIAHVDALLHQVIMKWDAVDNASSYVIYRDGVRIAEDITETQYNHNYSANDNGYHTYNISAVVEGNESGQSEPRWVIIGNYENLRLNITSTSSFGTKGGELEVTFDNGMKTEYLTIYDGETTEGEYYIPANTNVTISWVPGFDHDSEGIHVAAKRYNQNGETSLFDIDRPQEGVLVTYTVADNGLGLIAPQHISATSNGQEIQLNWTIPTENHSFDIYRGDRKIKAANDSYGYLDDKIMRSGTYHYHVETSFEGVSTWNPDQSVYASIMNYYCEPPKNLTGSYNDGDVELSWEAPEFFGQGLLAYDDNTFVEQIGSSSHKWGIKMAPELLAHFAGHPLTHIELFDCSTGLFTFTIYNGELANDNTSIYVQTRDMEARYEFVRFALDEPVEFDPTLPLWICVSTSGAQGPIPCCEYVGDGNSCLLKQGSNWKPATQFNVYRSWLLRGYTSPIDGSDDFSYNVYWGPEEGGEEHLYLGYEALTATQASYNTTENQRYNVTAFWDGRETELSNTIYLGPSVGLEEIMAEHKAVKVYPNPSTGSFTIESAEESTVSIFNMLGQSIMHQEKVSGIQQINLEDAPKGMYLVRIQSGNDTDVKKLIIN